MTDRNIDGNKRFSFQEAGNCTVKATSREINSIKDDGDWGNLPQANDVSKILYILDIIGKADHPLAKEDVVREMESDGKKMAPRIVKYYLDACEILGLADYEEKDARYCLSEAALQSVQTGAKGFSEYLVRQMLTLAPVRWAVNYYREYEKLPSETNLVNKLCERDRTNLKAFSETTLYRRAQTLLSWARWTLEHLEIGTAPVIRGDSWEKSLFGEGYQSLLRKSS